MMSKKWRCRDDIVFGCVVQCLGSVWIAVQVVRSLALQLRHLGSRILIISLLILPVSAVQ